jgi:hypothetical protein
MIPSSPISDCYLTCFAGLPPAAPKLAPIFAIREQLHANYLAQHPSRSLGSTSAPKL